MKINFIFHKFQESPPSCELGDSNIIVCEENEILDERKLVFGPIVCRSSIGFKTQVEGALRALNWPPLLYPFNQRATSFGYSMWEGFNDMLNHDIRMYYFDQPLSASLIKLKWDHFAGGVDKSLWIRSESGQKLFTGGVFTKEQFETEYQYLLQNKKHWEWLVIAPPKSLRREWRLFIVNNEVISHSQYMKGGNISILPPNKTPKDVVKFATKWALKWGHNFCGAFVLDIGERIQDNGDVHLKVVEINSILTSGAYEANMGAVIRAIKQDVERKCKA